MTSSNNACLDVTSLDGGEKVGEEISAIDVIGGEYSDPGPLEVLHDVEHEEGLLRIRRHCAHEHRMD